MEDFVTFELAKKLKEKGFSYPCIGHYVDNQIYIAHYQNAFHSDNDESIDAPTISQVLKWLREEKRIHIGFGYSPRKKWRYVVMYMDDKFYTHPTLAVDGFLKFEQAALAGIEYVIDNFIV